CRRRRVGGRRRRGTRAGSTLCGPLGYDIVTARCAVDVGGYHDSSKEIRMALMDDAELRARTKRTSEKLFHTLKGGSGFETWKRFDKGLARELSRFFTGVLYRREV